MTRIIFTTLVILFSLLTHYSSYADSLNSNKATILTLNKNERLTVVIVKSKVDGEQAQKEYLEGIQLLAKNDSIREVGIFPITRTLSGLTKPQAIAFYAWQDAAASHEVRHSSHYKNNLKPLQKKGWEHLSAADVDLTADQLYQLSPDKTYTLAEVWLKDTATYDLYYQGTKSLREKMGAKVIFKHSPNEYNSLNDGQEIPNFIILIEWQTAKGPESYTQSDDFKKQLPFIEASISHLNWYEIGFWPNGTPVY